MLFLLTILFLGSCKNFVNLEPIGFSVYPGTDNMVLPEEKTVLSVQFDTPMKKSETQKTLSVHSVAGSVKGDLFWSENKLVFIPLEPWLPGHRYSLSLEGTLYAQDGRDFRVSRHTAFYALNKNGAPHVLTFTPADGTSVGVNSEGRAFVSISFSQPMDCQSVIDAFYIDGVSERDFHWSAGDTVMEMHPKNKLNPWTVYRWSLNGKARGKNGVQLGKETSGHFITDADRILPAVREVFPLIKGNAAMGLWWIKTGANLTNGLGSGQAIGIEFNKAMDESVLRNIRFDPPLAGQSEMWKPDTVVFIPDRDPEPEKYYTLFVSGADTMGLKMEKEFTFSFVADIPYLKILFLDAGFGEIKPEPNGVYPAGAVFPEGLLTIAIRFSHMMNSQGPTVLAIKLETYFPGNLKPLGFRSARWWSADTVVLQWEGIERNTTEDKHYYRLVLPGGRSGISDGKGSYLKEDMFFFLETKDKGDTN
ncbi:MAG: Ig-like domain-containing protein [Treponema sp.]|jgi:hypothetical protein|nr:Ig-like domain-containing protein [Treponema sp.]